MPLLKPTFTPGVVKDESKLAAEGGWVDSDKIRFVGDKPQVIGGWEELVITQDPNGPVFDSNVFDPNVFYNDLTEFETIYPGQVRGAHAWTDLDGASYLAFGTGAGLFVLHNGIVFDITPADFVPETGTNPLPYGAGPYGMGPYGRASRVIWSLDNWGQNLLASQRGGSLYEWTPTTAKALPVANAPGQINSFFVSPERIVVLLGTEEFGGDYNPMVVRWSDQGDNTSWTPSPFNLAGEFPLAQGSKLIAGLVTRGMNMVWSDSAVYAMQFTGAVNSVYILRCVGQGCGLIGPHAMCASDSAVYWVSRNNFYMFNGQVPVVLPCTIWQDVFENFFPNNEEKAHVGWNTGYGEVWFFYPDKRDSTGECSRYAAMNPQGKWFPGMLDRTAWVRAGVFPFPVAFSANERKIFYQEVPDAGAAGEPLDAFVESGFIDVGDGDTLYLIKRIVPDFNNQGPNVNISIKTRMWPNRTETTRGPYTATPTTEKIDTRIKAREMAIRLESSGVATNSFWELGAIAFDTQQSGEKR